MFHGKQWLVVSHVPVVILFGLSVAYLFKTNAIPFVRTNFPADISEGQRLTFAFRCLAFSILPLAFAVQSVASRRFANINTLGANPTAPLKANVHTDFQILQRILQNTLEQTVYHIIVVLALASTVGSDQLWAVPCVVFLFIFARVAFYIGYLYFENRLSRAFGFGLTFMSSSASLVYVIFCILSGAFSG